MIMKTIELIALPSHQRVSDITAIIDALRQHCPGVNVRDFLEGEFLLKKGARTESQGHAIIVLDSALPASARHLVLEAARYHDPHAFLHLTTSGGYATAIGKRPDDSTYGRGPADRQPDWENDTVL